MESIGILIYGKVDYPDFIKAIKSIKVDYNIDLTKYEVCIQCIDLESRQKWGDWTSQDITDYLSKVSPNIYNVYLERVGLLSLLDQRIELLNYLIGRSGKIIIISTTDAVITEEELKLIDSLDNIKLIV